MQPRSAVTTEPQIGRRREARLRVRLAVRLISRDGTSQAVLVVWAADGLCGLCFYEPVARAALIETRTVDNYARPPRRTSRCSKRFSIWSAPKTGASAFCARKPMSATRCSNR